MHEENKKINTNQILQEGFSEAEKLQAGLESFSGSAQLMTKGFGGTEKNIQSQITNQPSQSNNNIVKVIVPKSV